MHIMLMIVGILTAAICNQRRGARGRRNDVKWQCVRICEAVDDFIIQTDDDDDDDVGSVYAGSSSMWDTKVGMLCWKKQ